MTDWALVEKLLAEFQTLQQQMDAREKAARREQMLILIKARGHFSRCEQWWAWVEKEFNISLFALRPMIARYAPEYYPSGLLRKRKEKR